MNHSLLPPNASAFERSLEVVTTESLPTPHRLLWNPDECPENLMYILALTLDVDVWDERWSKESKVATLKDAYNVHRLRGTPSSIRRILRNAGYEEITISEGLNIRRRDGTFTRNAHQFRGWDEAWAMYRIYLKRAITNQQSKQVRRLLEDTAPLHCELMGIHYKEALFLHNGEIRRDGTYNRGTA
ncbi:TPA: phage tail protein I [Vibrio cholerae]|nr:phage tail protein I [Vibrio cholerae]HBK7239042.1 phage tail protein I [Vibrio cholerae]